MEPQSRTKWVRENCVKMTIKFFRKGDADILEFLAQAGPKATIVKAALREYMEHHTEGKIGDQKK